MKRYSLDSSVWVSYLGGERKDVKELIENGETRTSALALAEVSDVLLRQGDDPARACDVIRRRSTVLQLTQQQAQQGARIKHTARKQNPKFGLADGIHLAVARDQGCTLLTLDNDFRGVIGARVLDT